jgi:hypothetical protein
MTASKNLYFTNQPVSDLNFKYFVENISPWPLLRAGKAEQEQGLRLDERNVFTVRIWHEEFFLARYEAVTAKENSRG